MTVTSEEFRDALRHFPAGVTIVTIRVGEEVHGLTVSAFCSVSPQPPLVLFVIDHRHTGYELLSEAGSGEAEGFAVNFLGGEQIELSNRFAWVKDEDRFDVVEWEPAPVTGAPVLQGAVAWLDCTIHSSHAAGNHTVYVGRVEASRVQRPGAPPLVYWNRGYRALELHDLL